MRNKQHITISRGNPAGAKPGSRIYVLLLLCGMLLPACKDEDKKIEPTDVKVSVATLSLTIGDRATVTATPVPAGAVATFVWTSENPAVATVSDGGEVTATGAGETGIVVAHKEISRKIRVVVAKAGATGISLTPTSLNMMTGDRATITATPVPADADATFVWTSENQAVATVSDGGEVTATGPGFTGIVVSQGAVSKKAAVTVTVPDYDVVPGGRVYSFTKTASSYSFDRAEYAVFIPENVDKIRGVFVHQHGCTMEGVGASTAYDIQYQALAKKWGLALVAPDLYAAVGNCDRWRDTESGSADALFRVLQEAGVSSGHPELASAPLLLWGHSGGGYWTLSMLKNYPERLMAVFAYSPAFRPVWSYPAAAFKVPVMIRHAGQNDANTPPISCWATAAQTFIRLRQSGAYAGIAKTATQNHNFSYVRYMAIPFYEAVLAQRLSASGMQDMNESVAWLGDTLTCQIYKASTYVGNVQKMCWLPDEYTAGKWKEYVTTGTVVDVTLPPPPYSAKREQKSQTVASLAWKANADIESGIGYFKIYKNGQYLVRFPSSGEYQTFVTNGDNAVPGKTLPAMQTEVNAGESDRLTISTVNRFSLESIQTEASKN
jgi:pimeloyl-ACP methyl ester carboxylesterase